MHQKGSNPMNISDPVKFVFNGLTHKKIFEMNAQ